MKFEEVHSMVGDIPFMEPERARALHAFIIKNRLSSVLELGFAHGVSSCYIAAALDELGDGRLTSVDLSAAREWQKPSIEDLLARTGLQKYVRVAREQTSYTWFLKKMIEEQSSESGCRPVYDLCFIDGAKNWTIDGLAFFAVDKLLKKGGWILFDDFGWKYSGFGQDVMDGISLRTMGKDELEVPHIEAVFRLLVMQHPDYANFKIQDGWWAWAQKTRSAEQRRPTVRVNGNGAAKAGFLARVGRRVRGTARRLTQ